MDADLQHLVKAWLRLDRDGLTVQEVRHLQSTNNTTALEKCMRPRIAFGTAGLRARMGAGFANMNALTVIQASQGLASYLVETHTRSLATHDDTKSATASQNATKTVEDTESDTSSKTHGLGIVIGRDARHNSARFARLAASVFDNAGFRVFFLDECHTPMVPFCVKTFHASAGVMVTASHNPAADNGYKVYWANACQIIPPHDKGIAKAIQSNLEPRIWSEDAFTNALTQTDDADAHVEEYVNAITSLARLNVDKCPTFTYTAMHGVGLRVLTKCLDKQKVTLKMHIVESQAQPDPDFPTVKYPNPEEQGALVEAIKTADSHGDELILANDPDADRFCVAVKDDGEWKQLSGNQMGVLLGSYALETCSRNGRPITMLATTVSSRMLARIAEVDGTFEFHETLTGFKWLGNKAIDLDAAGCQTIYAYEEALGYMFPSVAHDKDGIAAAIVFLAAVRHWSSQGMSPMSKLQSLYEKYGHFEEANTYLRSPSPDVTKKVFDAIRNPRPDQVGARKILRWRDLTAGFDTATADNRPELPVDPETQMITCELEGDVRFTARASGTEPKIKLYIEARASPSDTARAAAESVFDDLLKEWFKPEQNGLTLP